MELIDLYPLMAKARAFELALADLWRQGLISGEMHLGVGEEAVAAGVVAHIREGDALAVDHRSTPPLVVRGVDMVSMLREMLGRDDGLCRGMGGHMHLLCPDHLAASSGIVGSSGPVGAGFALAGKVLRPGSVAVAFFGDGAMNQGMLLETFNLAVAWKLPLVFVCKNNRWAVTTETSEVTGGEPVERARAFGLDVHSVDGLDARAVWLAAGSAIDRARRGNNPAFIHATCSRLEGHLLGDLMLRVASRPVGEGSRILGKIAVSALKPGGGGIASRISGMSHVLGLLGKVREMRFDSDADPLHLARKILEEKGIDAAGIDGVARREVMGAVEIAMGGEGG